MHANIAKKFLARKPQNYGVELNFYEPHTSLMKNRVGSQIVKAPSPLLPEDPVMAGRRLRLFRKYVLKIDTIGELARRLGIDQPNRLGNWERGSPYEKYMAKIAALKPGLNPTWFMTGSYINTAFEVVAELEAAEAEAATGGGKGTTTPRR